MKKKFNTDKVLTVSGAHFFHDVYSAFLAPILPLLIEKLGLSLSMVGLLDVIRKIPTLFNPLIGLMADRICVKYLIILSPALSAISMSLLGLAPTYPILVLLLFVSGISASLFHVPAPVVIKQFSGNKTGAGMSFYMLGGELARSVGPLLITAAVSWWGLEGSYKIMPIGIVASIILYFKLWNISEIAKNRTQKSPERSKESLKPIIPIFAIVGSFLLTRAGIKSALTLYLPVYLTSQGESLWLAGISLSILQFAGAMGTLGAGYFSDKFGKRNILLISAVLTPIIMWGFLSVDNVWLSFPLLILVGLLLFAQGPVLLAYFLDLNSLRPALVNSIYMTINFGVSALIVMLVGFSGDMIGLELTFEIATFMAFLAIPIIYLLPKDK
ncbi:MAG: MFS transporter [Bacteroidetes bacterium 4572_77]|nr:MAG: MFS transporter [Bacteroidetes bacterium 4572_77]